MGLGGREWGLVQYLCRLQVKNGTRVIFSIADSRIETQAGVIKLLYHDLLKVQTDRQTGGKVRT